MSKNIIIQVASLLSVLFLAFILILIGRNTIPTFAQESSPTPSAQITPAPSDTSTPTPTEQPSPSLTATPTPTVSPTDSPTATPTDTPSASPTPTVAPTPTTSESPSPTPTVTTTSEEGQIAAYLYTDQSDYSPTQTAIIFGNNFKPNEKYTLEITSDNLDVTIDVTSDSSGNFAYSYQLDGTYRPLYNVVAKDSSGAVIATTSFTDSNPSASLDQCANDPAPSPHTDGCSASASDWVNGNLGASKSSYFEGDSIPYRMVFGSLSTTGSHTVTIEWDTTKSSKHATDYLTTFNQTVANADPCLGVSGCSAFNTFPIPPDPQVTGAGVTPVAGNFRMYGGTITSVSPYSYANGAGFAGDKSARITITFTASQANPVLAWGGHISTRADWGLANSAISIPGSPYHMRLIDLDGSGGNQDRSLSADAVIFPGSITIIKDATPNGSTSFPFTASPSPLSNFSLVDDGTSANTKLIPNITNFQTYSVNETPVPSGWGFDSVSCSVTSANGGSSSSSTTTVSIDMKEGENWTCTYLNSLRTGTLNIIKHVINNDGGSATAANFNLHVKSSGTDVTGSPAAGSESGTSYALNQGTYNVSEDSPVSGYSNVTNDTNNGDCDGSGNVTIVAGQTKTCTITNDDQAAHLIVIKHVTNDNGGSKVAGGFSTTISSVTAATPTAPGVESPGVDNVLTSVGAYSVDEGAHVGYNKTLSADCSGTIALGQTKTCTITNDDIAPKLHLRKVVTNDNGGTATVANFTLNADGTGVNDLSGTSPVDSGAGLKADTFALSETNPDGYTASSWVCAGGTQNDSNITLGINEEATCTITNNDNAPSLTLNKITSYTHSGTAPESSWTLTANGGVAGTLSGPGAAGSADVVSDATFKSGIYTLSESAAPTGYTNGASYSCMKNGGDAVSSNSITLAVGDTAVCSITNTDVQPKLTVTKVVKNHGGNKQVSDFPLFVEATGVTSGVQNGFDAGSYTVSETGDSNYTETISGDCNSQTGSVTLAVGDIKSCTITNEEKPAKFIVHKVVVNHGLQNDATHFAPYKVDSTTVTLDAENTFNSGTYTVSELAADTNYTASFSQDCNAQGSVTLVPGTTKECTITNEEKPATIVVHKIIVNHGLTNDATHFTPYKVGDTTVTLDSVTTINSGTYTVSETTDPNYTATFTAGDCNVNGSVTVTPGSTKSCTITNEENPTHLTVKKVVINHGQNKVATDFGPFNVDSSPVVLDASNLVNSGVHSVTENQDSNYTVTYLAECPDGSVTLATGDNKTCTITNEEKPAKLIVVKIVTNDNGGTKQVSDFPLFVDQGVVASGDTNTFDSGAHVVSETGSADYAATISGDCNPQTGSVTLIPGQTKTCIIANDDIPAHLIVIKHVITDNGGNAVAGDFNMSIAGITATGGNSFAGSELGTDKTLTTVGSYNVTEIGPGGYSESVSVDCNGTIDLGQTKTCTVTNDDIQPILTVNKIVQNNHGGTLGGSDFPLFVGATPVTNGIPNGFNAGAYIVSETGQTGYTQTSVECDEVPINSVTLAAGDVKSCTITNEDIAPQLTVIKHVVNDNGGRAVAGAFTMNITGTNVAPSASFPGDESGTTVTLNQGTYSVDEYAFQGYTKSLGSDCSGTINVGDHKTCTITNDDQPATLIVIKDADPNDLQDFVFGGTLGAFTLDDDAGVFGEDTVHSNSQTFNNLSANTNYTVAETLPNLFWKLNGVSCVETGTQTPYSFASVTNGVTVNLKLGGSVTCTFNNHKDSPTRTLGFWQTHTAYTTSIFSAAPLSSSMLIGDGTTHKGPVDTIGKVFGAFYSSIPKKSDGKTQRNALDKARMTLLQQLVAAKLNCAAFGCAVSVQTMISTADSAYATGTSAQILVSASLLDAFNNSGDTIIIGNAGSATPKTSQSIAGKAFWDTP